MARPPKDTATRLIEVIAAWEALRPQKVFYGLTCEEFKSAVKPFMQARAVVIDLQARLQQAIAERQRSLEDAKKLLLGVLSAVKGDPGEGEDGELYAAMGYVSQTQRHFGSKLMRQEK